MSALLTAREVADLLGVSPETILRWTRRGELAAIRLPGGALRYREDDLHQWLDTRATLPVTPTERPRAAGTAGGMAHEENAS
jgi:excisionase family DNA binding protein